MATVPSGGRESSKPGSPCSAARGRGEMPRASQGGPGMVSSVPYGDVGAQRKEAGVSHHTSRSLRRRGPVRQALPGSWLTLFLPARRSAKGTPFWESSGRWHTYLHSLDSEA